MSKRALPVVGEFYQHYPKIPVVVTASWGGKENALACAWHTALSFSPPLYGVAISPKRFTYRLIVESKQFGVNFLPWEKAQIIAHIGGTTGEEVDKFKTFGIEKVKPIKLQVPILKDAYAAYECQVVEQRTYGDHEWLVGEIVAVMVQDKVLTKEEVIELSYVKPVLYMGKDHYVTVDKESLCYLKRG